MTTTGDDNAGVRQPVSRRSVLILGGSSLVGAGLLAGAGAIGYAWPRSTKGAVRPTATATTRNQFRTEPNLDPPGVVVTSLEAANDSGYIFLTPSVVPGERVSQQAGSKEGLGQEGTMILDQFGHLVWFQPTAQITTNLRVQTYQGKPVLTYWRGAVINGIGKGEGVILDSAYREIAIVKAGGSTKQDLHDFTLTPNSTALITAYSPASADLTSVGGPTKGSTQDCMVQEIDVASGKVIFEWHSLEHVPVAQSYAKPVGDANFDYFHINSVELDGDDHLLISSRNTWTVYQLNRSTGTITWRLGGKSSDFKMGSGTQFAWQHHATRLADGNISLFDDESAPTVGPQSRAIIVDANLQTHAATLVKSYTHPAKLLSEFEGSAQVLPNGHMFVGWGGEPYFSEFNANGTLVLDGRLPTNDQSYRAFRMPWHATPAGAPAIATEADEVGGVAVYASWNGATEVTHWQVLAGASASGLTSIVTVPRNGFETAVTVHTTKKYLAVAALDDTGHRLGISKAVRT